MPQIVMHTKEPVQVGDAFAPALNQSDRHVVVQLLGTRVALAREGVRSGAHRTVSVGSLADWWVRV